MCIYGRLLVLLLLSHWQLFKLCTSIIVITFYLNWTSFYISKCTAALCVNLQDDLLNSVCTNFWSWRRPTKEEAALSWPDLQLPCFQLKINTHNFLFFSLQWTLITTTSTLPSHIMPTPTTPPRTTQTLTTTVITTKWAQLPPLYYLNYLIFVRKNKYKEWWHLAITCEN